ncbi:hypothetical protein CY34DRAFT_7717 [Suillus luteus UH-Slu-Lm8-n1]|uniref:Uncharacterized protein n=1 Tax=Suillus luteus UH-Slu-Lm8-n1 TaxID=930992 RepID=A0A0D0B4S4_9AGAM|nr:hypothetical protein CY34DRAFT_7717 [Suillus luteus UH-Slu-Lm8-n1]
MAPHSLELFFLYHSLALNLSHRNLHLIFNFIVTTLPLEESLGTTECISPSQRPPACEPTSPTFIDRLSSQSKLEELARPSLKIRIKFFSGSPQNNSMCINDDLSITGLRASWEVEAVFIKCYHRLNMQAVSGYHGSSRLWTENEEFALSVEAAGMIWLGPQPDDPKVSSSGAITMHILS